MELLLHTVHGFREQYSPLSRGLFDVSITYYLNMTIIHTLTKQLEDRTATWRFVQTPDGDYCSIGGNYKIISYRSKAAMTKSYNWFLSKGFAVA